MNKNLEEKILTVLKYPEKSIKYFDALENEKRRLNDLDLEEIVKLRFELKLNLKECEEIYDRLFKTMNCSNYYQRVEEIRDYKRVIDYLREYDQIIDFEEKIDNALENISSNEIRDLLDLFQEESEAYLNKSEAISEDDYKFKKYHQDYKTNRLMYLKTDNNIKKRLIK